MKHKLQLATKGDREIVMTRTFDAPREMVFDAHTKPELIKRWLGAFKGWTMDVCEVDLRIGGRYRFVWTNADDKTSMGMGGTYKEVVRSERLVNTEKFDDPWYEGEMVATLAFVEKNGATTLTSTWRYGSEKIRDSVMKSPMETGLVASYDALEELLQSATASK